MGGRWKRWDKERRREQRERAAELAARGEVWRETGGEERARLERVNREMARKEIEWGLADCPVCGGRAKIVEFGMRKEGVWVGCARSAECARNVVLHSEGWSVLECAEEWNRLNSGIFLLIRRLKMWYAGRYGRIKRMERRCRWERAKEIERINRERGEFFGIEAGIKRRGVWKRMLSAMSLKGKIPKREVELERRG